MATVALRGLDKWFGGYHAIRSIDLSIVDRSFVALVGPSGCGKSTTLRLIAGLEMPSSGRLLIGDRDVTELPPRDRRVSMVFQSYALFPHMTVRQTLGFGLRVSGVRSAERDQRVLEAARLLEVERHLDRRPAQLSGGQRQRVAIGRAIVRHPEVFLFDEPLSNLDAQLRNTMRTELKRLHQRLQSTIIFVTHDQTEAMTMADQIVLMRDGRIEQVGTPLELFQKPANAFVAGFIGAPAMRFFTGEVEVSASAPAVRLAGGEVLPVSRSCARLEHGRRVRIGIRPEDVVPRGHGLSPVNGFEFSAPVILSEPLGNETLLVTPFGGGEVMSRMYRPNPVRVGDRIDFTIDTDQIHVFDHDSEVSLFFA
jgi:multiple sugar transport system ATP-binding protein